MSALHSVAGKDADGVWKCGGAQGKGFRRVGVCVLLLNVL